MLPYFMISPIKLTVALSSASMASAVEVLLISVPEFRISERMSCDELWPMGNQIYLVTLRPTQLTQASFLQKNQMLQNVFF